MTEQTPIFIAYHEAGHTVADVLHGRNPAIVSIHPKDDTLGSAHALDGWDEAESARTYLIGLYAGYAAEVEKGQDEAVAREGACSDFENADRVIECLNEGSKEYWIGKASEFVREHWAAVQSLAKELLEHERLDGGEIELIVKAAEGEPYAYAALAAYRAMRRSTEN